MRLFCLLILLGGVQLGAVEPAKRPPNIVLLLADDIGWGDFGCYGAKVIPTPAVDRLAAQGTRFTGGYCTASTCTPSRYSLLTGEYAWRRQGTGILPGDATMIIKPGRPTLPASLAKLGYATGVVGKWHLGLGDKEVNWNQRINPCPNEVGFTYSFIMAATGDRVPCVFVEDGRVVNLDPADPIEVSYLKPFPNDPDLKLPAERAKLKMDWSQGHNMALVNGVGRIGWMKGGKSAIWNDETLGETFTDKACAFIAKHKDQPFFLYYAAHENHVPRVPNPVHRGKTPLGPRGDAVVAFDDHVDKILAELEKHGLTENTLVVLSSDNGPVLDDGYRDQALALNRKAGHLPAGPYRGGKYSIYEGGTRVSMIARWPGHTPAGVVSTEVLSQIDFPASFTKLAGGDPVDFLKLDGLENSCVFIGEKSQRNYVIEQGQNQVAVRQGDWKYIPAGFKKGQKAWRTGELEEPDREREIVDGQMEQLYDLSKDVGEKQNVIAENPEVAQRLRAILVAEKAKGFAQPLPR
jgi:arylsulfatase A-like enzyme